MTTSWYERVMIFMVFVAFAGFYWHQQTTDPKNLCTVAVVEKFKTDPVINNQPEWLGTAVKACQLRTTYK